MGFKTPSSWWICLVEFCCVSWGPLTVPIPFKGKMLTGGWCGVVGSAEWGEKQGTVDHLSIDERSRALRVRECQAFPSCFVGTWAFWHSLCAPVLLIPPEWISENSEVFERHYWASVSPCLESRTGSRVEDRTCVWRFRKQMTSSCESFDSIFSEWCFESCLLQVGVC